VSVFTLWFVEAGLPGTCPLREGVTLIGRSPACDLVLTSPTASRRHARVRVEGDRVLLSDAGSSFGTLVDGEPITGERKLAPGASFVIGQVQFTLTRDDERGDVLSDAHQVYDESATILRSIELFAEAAPPASDSAAEPSTRGTAVGSGAPAARGLAPAGSGLVAPSPAGERRGGTDRRTADVGRVLGNRRSGRDRRGGRVLRLLSDISKTLVTVQPIEHVLSRVTDLVFEAVPAERAFLILRDTWDQPLTARVLKNRDGSVPDNVSISRTVVNQVVHERVAMLAQDARVDERLGASSSVHALNVRSFMCAPLWNRNEVIGVLYCDNPRSRQFTADDLEVFTALSNYAAVAIEQARLSKLLLEETRRRERLQRYHSPAVVSRILHGQETAERRFLAQERDVSVMFTDIVGFTKLCEHMAPAAVGDLLNDYFGNMADIIFEHEGTLDKFIGDAILAVFGAPFDQPDHAVRCVAAALEMRAAARRMNATRPAPPIAVRIAINTGRALTGDMGSPRRKEFTTLGDVVNTASRIEKSVAQPDQIVVTDATRQQLGDRFRLSPLGSFAIRGREAAIEAFEVLD
jgi:adenylate cyclase